MATRLISVPTVPGASGSRSSVVLTVGLATLIMSLLVFLLGMMLPEPSLHHTDVFAGAENRAGVGQDAGGRDATRTPRSLSRLAPVIDWPAADPRSPALTTPDRTKAEPLDDIPPGPKVQSRSAAVATSRETAVERGTRAESAH